MGILRINVIAYAEDIVLLAESTSTLLRLYGELADGLSALELNMKKMKSKRIIFQKSRAQSVANIKLGEDILEVVPDYKYLGHMIDKELLDTSDIKHQLNNFYAKFNSVFRNFRNVSIRTFMFLFNSYCLPEYGLTIWNTSNILRKHIYKTFETGYSNSLKKIVGVPMYASSHITADICNVLLFHHHLSYIQVRYIKRLFNVKNPIIRLSIPYLQSGYLCNSITNHFKSKYNVNIWSNELDVLRSRIAWVQKHEVRGVCHFYGV